MTKRQAYALLRAQRVINRTLDACKRTMDEQEKEHAEAYWMGQIRRAIGGSGYASAPVDRAEELLSWRPHL